MTGGMVLANQDEFNKVAAIAKTLPPEARRQLIIFLQDMSCVQCLYYKEDVCTRFGGKLPPPKIQASGCKDFEYDIPF
ncbi:hypothetical protein [Salmonella phage S144]|uniref:Uncharacterized protein n=1 Tax=Salmonella phage S144 TaxID=2759179 RepID=A0A7G5CF39_9CAUD|nr:hypothetical protein [Salmonella phage S144]